MEKTFEGFTKAEFVEYLKENESMDFNNFYECALENDEIVVWNIYDHNNCEAYSVDEFFDCFGY